MRTTITLDDALLAQAREMTGLLERSALIHEGLRSLIQREAARRLAVLGGTMTDAAAAPRKWSRPATVPPDIGTAANTRSTGEAKRRR